VNVNFQVTSLLENTTSHEYVGLHAQSTLISPSIFGQLQSLFGPFSVIKFFFESLNIRLMRVLDDKGS